MHLNAAYRKIYKWYIYSGTYQKNTAHVGYQYKPTSYVWVNIVPHIVSKQYGHWKRVQIHEVSLCLSAWHTNPLCKASLNVFWFPRIHTLQGSQSHQQCVKLKTSHSWICVKLSKMCLVDHKLIITSISTRVAAKPMILHSVLPVAARRYKWEMRLCGTGSSCPYVENIWCIMVYWCIHNRLVTFWWTKNIYIYTNYKIYMFIYLSFIHL